MRIPLPHAVRLALAIALMAWGAPTARGEEMGAFITLVNTYAYPKGPRKGERILIRSRVALAVLNQAHDEGDRLWYQVLLADRAERQEGTGWTPLTAQELLARGAEAVPLYSRPLDANLRPFQTMMVPASDIELAHETQHSADFPQVEWQKVRYVSRLPLTVWVRAGAGIYRPGKTPGFLTQSYAEMATRQVPKETVTRLLAGVVRPGDSAQEVRWALGEPQRVSEQAAEKRAVWEYVEAKIHFEHAVVKQVE